MDEKPLIECNYTTSTLPAACNVPGAYSVAITDSAITYDEAVTGPLRLVEGGGNHRVPVYVKDGLWYVGRPTALTR